MEVYKGSDGEMVIGPLKTLFLAWQMLKKGDK